MENLDIDKFLDNDYDTIAKPDYSSLSLEERASRGDADAQNELGTAYMQGYGVQLDYKKGLHWFIEAAAQGHTGAFANLGICFLTGLGIPKNYKNAFKLLKNRRSAAMPLLNITWALCTKTLSASRKTTKWRFIGTLSPQSKTTRWQSTT